MVPVCFNSLPSRHRACHDGGHCLPLAKALYHLFNPTDPYVELSVRERQKVRTQVRVVGGIGAALGLADTAVAPVRERSA